MALSKKEQKIVADQLRHMADKFERGEFATVNFRMEQLIDREFRKNKTLFMSRGLVMSVGGRYTKSPVAEATPVKKGKK